MEHRKGLNVERENVQKRTFTRWINLHLEKCKPPLQVQDLFIDIQDGKILMALLEVLSGQSLLHEYKSSSHRIFRLNNIAKALAFLENCNVKLVSIDAAEIADGNSSLILGLIWNIILFFQIKEFTGNLNKMTSSSSLSSVLSCPDSDTSQPSTPTAEKSVSVSVRDQRKAIKALLSWVQERTRKYGVAVQDFAGSWQSGLAFLAVIKAIDSKLINMKQAFERSPQENLEEAFNIAYAKLGIPKLLEPEDLTVESPDEQSIITYVAQFLEHFPELEGEDISEAKEDSPVETTYVHIKDGPKEQEGTVFIVNENGDCAVTVCHESTQPAAQKINLYTEMNVRDKPHSENAQAKSNGDLTPSLKRHAQTPVEEEEEGNLPVLLPAESHRSNSWHAAGAIHFQPDDSWRDLSDKRPHYEQTSENHAQEMRRNDTLTVSPNGKRAVDVNNSELPFLEVPTNYSSEVLNSSDPLKQSSKTQDSSLNTPGVSDSESFSSAVDESDGVVYQRDDHPSEETLSIMEPFTKENDLNVLMKPRKEEETIKYILHLQEKDALKKPAIACEHPPQMSNLEPVKVNAYLASDSRQRGQPDLFRSTRSETVVQSSQKSHEPPTVHNGGGSVSEASPGSAKVSVIPHDLFYYPHYTVPIADVLDAFVKPDAYDSKNDDTSNQLLLNGVQEQEESHRKGQQTLRKTNNAVFSAQVDKSISRNIASEASLDVEFQEAGCGLAVNDKDTNQKEKLDSVSRASEASLDVEFQEAGCGLAINDKDSNQKGKLDSVSRASEASLDVEFQEAGCGLANSSFSDMDTNQRGKLDSVSRATQSVFSSEEADSVVRKQLTDSGLNYSMLTKTDSTSNGTSRSSENVEPVENHFKDASTAVLGQEIYAKMSKKKNVEDAEEKVFPTWENRSVYLPEEVESNSFANLCLLRPTSSDTSINYQHYNTSASDMDPSSEIEQKNDSVLQEANVTHRKKVKWEDEPEVKISSEPEALSLSEHFPDILYFLLLLWLLIYLLLILPELSIGKLRFLQQ
ncbi:calmin isoform X2 [Microcaecilia unicolor]|uniref:Calmin n=1 Tax=Microcaecilia unicolor TaxID=1415580 RepID=A0A6P7Z4D5_9AMPH|nr:calmin isoform X2 [Microcaecilia unicolor]